MLSTSAQRSYASAGSASLGAPTMSFTRLCRYPTRHGIPRSMASRTAWDRAWDRAVAGERADPNECVFDLRRRQARGRAGQGGPGPQHRAVEGEQVVEPSALKCGEDHDRFCGDIHSKPTQDIDGSVCSGTRTTSASSSGGSASACLHWPPASHGRL